MVKRCSVDACDSTVVARGWCKKHYSRWRINGDPVVTQPRGRLCDASCTCARHKNKGKAGPGTVTPEGYRILSAQHGHPLAYANGLLLEHRKVLYDKIGPGPHQCFWCLADGLMWPGGSPVPLHVDHVDGDKLNNDVDNLVPSCLRCNMGRHRNQLVVEDVRVIRELYKAGKLTQEAVGEIFGVSGATVNRIVHHKLWWIDGG